VILERNLDDVRRLPYERARKSPYVHRHDYIGSYVADLTNVVDMEAIRLSGVKIGIDPLGGACVHFWQPIIERYGIPATIVSDAIDPTFRFMTVDWDEKIRMDCSSPYAMAGLIGMRDKFDVAFANDTDADRRGIVTRSNGLMNPNHYLAGGPLYEFRAILEVANFLAFGDAKCCRRSWMRAFWRTPAETPKWVSGVGR
jgi:phosphoglucomutase